MDSWPLGQLSAQHSIYLF
uniref:Uncharacterized protein n=1 Tax=Moniliophthora roreri TaxID=221103 RepID=A0A0W0FY82_MONRR